jgi:Fur family ferric uptake transcriptional regulator
MMHRRQFLELYIPENGYYFRMSYPTHNISESHAALRMTRQRKAVLDELRKMTSHPTASEIYDRVRQKVPRISLGTVYRSLEVLSRQGVIRVVQLNGAAQRRFDGRIENHYHVHCLRCGRLDDVPPETMGSSGIAPDHVGDYRVFAVRVELLGVCQTCEAAGKENL